MNTIKCTVATKSCVATTVTDRKQKTGVQFSLAGFLCTLANYIFHMDDFNSKEKLLGPNRSIHRDFQLSS